MFESIGEILLLSWRTLLALPHAWRQRQKVFEQFFEIGNASLLMVCMLSSMAAEIGSMRVYQEIDALRTMNINPIHYLVLPRMLAIAVALPLLVLFAILVGWFGGAFVANFNHLMEIPFRAFFSDLQNIVVVKDVANGVFKSFCFALIIGAVSCHQGLTTIGGPRGIGRSVTKAVVNSIVLIVICDYILTRMLLK